MTEWLPWAPLGAAVLHISEEFVFPGGFTAWYRRYRLDTSSITPRFLTIVNAALILACINIVMLGHTTAGIAYWLTISALLCSNGIWHVVASIRSRSYSPGVITGAAIYVPMAVYGYAVFIGSGAISMVTATFAAVIGGSYPFWSAIYHSSNPRPRHP